MSNERLNYCGHGYLINDRPLPSDPVDHDEPWGPPILGCNRMRCPICEVFVRNAPGLHHRDSIRKKDCEVLYQLADLAASPLLQPLSGSRFYVCRCSYWSETFDSRECDPDESEPDNSWSCGGHPLATLPHTFDGVEVSPENLAEIVARSLRGWAPPGAAAADRDSEYPMWTERLRLRLENTPWQDAVLMAGLPLLEDPDPTTRARTMWFLGRNRDRAVAEHTVTLLAGDRRLFAGVPDDLSGPGATLEDHLRQLAGERVSEPGPARDFYRSDALTTGKASRALYDALTAHDPDWVAEHVLKIADANPAQGEHLARSISSNFPPRLFTQSEWAQQVALAARLRWLAESGALNDTFRLPSLKEFPTGTSFMIKEFDVPLARIPGQGWVNWFGGIPRAFDPQSLKVDNNWEADSFEQWLDVVKESMTSPAEKGKQIRANADAHHDELRSQLDPNDASFGTKIEELFGAADAAGTGRLRKKIDILTYLVENNLAPAFPGPIAYHPETRQMFELVDIYSRDPQAIGMLRAVCEYEVGKYRDDEMARSSAAALTTLDEATKTMESKQLANVRPYLDALAEQYRADPDGAERAWQTDPYMPEAKTERQAAHRLFRLIADRMGVKVVEMPLSSSNRVDNEAVAAPSATPEKRSVEMAPQSEQLGPEDPGFAQKVAELFKVCEDSTPGNLGKRIALLTYLVENDLAPEIPGAYQPYPDVEPMFSVVRKYMGDPQAIALLQSVCAYEAAKHTSDRHAKEMIGRCAHEIMVKIVTDRREPAEAERDWEASRELESEAHLVRENALRLFKLIERRSEPKQAIKRAWAFESTLSLEEMKNALDKESSSPWVGEHSNEFGDCLVQRAFPDAVARIYAVKKGYVVNLTSQRHHYPMMFEGAETQLVGHFLPAARGDNVRECEPLADSDWQEKSEERIVEPKPEQANARRLFKLIADRISAKPTATPVSAPTHNAIVSLPEFSKSRPHVVSPDRRWLATREQPIQLWELEGPTLRHSFDVYNPWQIEFTPDSDRLLVRTLMTPQSGMEDEVTEQTYDVRTGALLNERSWWERQG